MRLALVLAVVVSLNAAPARACDPGPIFVVRVESADAPECLERSPVKSSPAAFGSAADSTQTARLRIRNRCKESANLSARTCAACGPGLTLAPGASGELVLETRGQGDAVDYDKHTKQVLTWTIGAGSGSIATDVTVTDDPAACGGIRPKKLLRGCNPCHVSAPRRHDDPVTSVAPIAVLALLVARRRARSRPLCRPKPH